ncbi:MAG: hypothetical protein WCX65_16015 [bacterium]
MADIKNNQIGGTDDSERESSREQTPANKISNPEKPASSEESDTPQTSLAYSEEEEELIRKRLEDLGYL